MAIPAFAAEYRKCDRVELHCGVTAKEKEEHGVTGKVSAFAYSGCQVFVDMSLCQRLGLEKNRSRSRSIRTYGLKALDTMFSEGKMRAKAVSQGHKAALEYCIFKHEFSHVRDFGTDITRARSEIEAFKVRLFCEKSIWDQACSGIQRDWTDGECTEFFKRLKFEPVPIVLNQCKEQKKPKEQCIEVCTAKIAALYSMWSKEEILKIFGDGDIAGGCRRSAEVHFGDPENPSLYDSGQETRPAQ